jgi:ribosomal protein S18 acetylase RimI-like enzyme
VNADANRIPVREAELHDLDVLDAFHGDRHLYHDRLSRHHDGRGTLLVAVLDDLPVGVIYVRWEPADEPEVRSGLPQASLVNNLWVHQLYRRRGVATALLAEAERLSRGRGRPAVALGVAPTNDDAIALYTSCGYALWRRSVPTTAETFDADGTRHETPDVCDMLFKKL